MKKILYLTTNPNKAEEAKRFLIDKYGLDLDIISPEFDIPEIQAESCSKIAAFSAKYAANLIGKPVLKSDSGLYIECLGGLPGPYNAYFASHISIEKFLEILKYEKNRKAKIEHCFAYCEPNSEPVVFCGEGTGTISYCKKGTKGSWHDKFYIPDGETKTLSELRDVDYELESSFWGDAKDQFAKWYLTKEKLRGMNGNE